MRSSGLRLLRAIRDLGAQLREATFANPRQPTVLTRTYTIPNAMDEQERALAEAAEAHAADSQRLNRPRILVQGTEEDVTENVVSLVDALEYAVEHGSGYLSAEEERAVARLKELLRFQCDFEKSEPSRPRFLAVPEVTVTPCIFRYGHEGPHSYEPDSPAVSEGESD